MPTFAQALAANDQQWTVVIRIEGVGAWMSTANLAATDGTGRTNLSTGTPTYAAGDPAGHWRDYLADLPDILSERADPLGGFPELGSISFAVLDYGDYLTSTIRTERSPVTRLTADCTSAATTLSVTDSSGITDTDVIFIGGEALRVEDVPTSTSIDVTAGRGYLGTTALPHKDTDAVYLSTPFIRNRKVEVYLVPTNGSRSDETLVASYAIDGLSWNASADGLNTWAFQAKSQSKYLHRASPREPSTYKVRVYSEDQIGYGQISLDGVRHINTIQLWTGSSNSDHRGFLKVGDEVLAISTTTPRGRSVTPYRRGLVGTQETELSDGVIASRVFLSEPLENDFRVSPGPTPSEDRTSGTWTKVNNAAQLMLILLLSSTHEEDGLELVNYEASGSDFATTNYSSLPPGYGVGVPSSLIDWASWEDFYQRTRDVTFPNFIFGHKTERFSELIQREFLMPLGAYLSVENGTIKIILPRTPLSGAAGVSLGVDNILSNEAQRGVYLPRLDVRQSIATHSASVVYQIGPQGEAVRTFDSAQFQDTFGQGGYYLADENPVLVKVPAGDPNDPDVFAPYAASRLFRFHRPNLEVDADLAMSVFSSLTVGTLASFTLNEMPNFSTGARGWSGVQVEMLEREPRMDLKQGAYIHARMLGYGPAIRVGRVSASAWIESVASSTVTVTTNRYTQADAAGGLPTQDCAAFEVDDFVMIIEPDGTIVAGVSDPEQVVSINTGTDEIELTGDFGTALAAGQILVFANHDDCGADQTDNYAFFADETSQTVGTGTDEPWIWGEP